MRYISSDTNIWLDFNCIDKLELPFRLSYKYLIHYEVLSREVISPPDLADNLIKLGLEETEMDDKEYFDVPVLSSKYVKLSLADAIALSIAKHRKIPVLTGDKALRKAARMEKVRVIGTLGIMDELKNEKLVSDEEYLNCLKCFLKHPERRLPEDQIYQRIKIIEEKGCG